MILESRALSRPPFTALAPAKVNLTLEIRGRRPDGYHELLSLVLFADYGDVVALAPAESWSFTTHGPFASAIDGGNLVERAAHGFADTYGTGLPFACRLSKNLPVAAGLGGGSSDAAATLRLLRQHFGVPAGFDALMPLAARLGADVPCCLLGRAALMSGIGETLAPMPSIAPIPAVLVNPMRPLATRDVFRELAAPPLTGRFDADAKPPLPEPDAVLAYAQASRNDLQAPAIALMPVIGDLLCALQTLPGVRLTRLSGSGPTCFALFGTPAEATVAAEIIAANHPGWWVRAVSLG